MPPKLRREDRDYEDLVRLYLEDVGRHDLLTKDDEVRLAQAIEAGVVAQGELEAAKKLTPTQRRQLRRSIRSGSRAAAPGTTTAATSATSATETRYIWPSNPDRPTTATTTAATARMDAHTATIRVRATGATSATPRSSYRARCATTATTSAPATASS